MLYMENTPSALKNSPFRHLINFIVGGLIGMAELVPGVSGGTVALVTGIYQRAIRNGDALLHAVRTLISKPSDFSTAIKRVEWIFIASIGAGMITAVLVLSGVMHDFVDNHIQTARALFLGMVAVSLIVPLKMVDKKDFATKRPAGISLFLLASLFIFFLTGMTSAEKPHPSLFMVFCAAAIAVCALVLPGISGSFMLLAMGLYQPVMGAIADRDLKVMAVFILGAMTGLALFIKVLKYLMESHHTLTMIAMAGFMLGSLRALWPWQTSNAELLPPSDNFLWCLGMFILGGIIAGAVMVLERFTDHDGEIAAHA